MYYGELMPGETIRRECELAIPADLDCSGDKTYYIEAGLSYQNEYGSDGKADVYWVKVPVMIYSPLEKPLTMESYVVSHVSLDVMTDKESYNPGKNSFKK